MTKLTYILLLLIPSVSSFITTTPAPERARLSSRRSSSKSPNDDPVAQNKNPSLAHVRHPADGSILLDHNRNPITVNRLLATKPLRKDLSTRPGPGGRELVYLSGETVISTLNQIFGYDGWNLQVLETKQEMRERLEDKRWCVVYTAHVRITLSDTGTFKEDYGTGDCTDRQLSVALQLGLKASITDAVKRAARHFGDKFGNCLYHDNFKITDSPRSLPEALDRFDQGR